MGQFGIGQPVRRVEDPRLLTGQGRYSDDRAIDGDAHGILFRSPYAHANITNLNVEAAKTAPGVLGITTAADIAALGAIPVLGTVQQKDGSDIRSPRFPILAEDRVFYAGQPIAFVVAETVEQAKDAAELIEIEFAPRTAISDPAEAARPGAPQIRSDFPDNRSFIWSLGDEDATQSALAAAPNRLVFDLVNNRLSAASLEPRVAIGEWRDGRRILTTTSQGPHAILRQLSKHIFREPEEIFLVRTPDVGGGFGMKIFLYPEQVLVLHAAQEYGRPVRWTGERTADAFPADLHGRDQVNHVEVGYDETGRILGLRVETLANLGAFVSTSAPYIATECGAPLLTGVYAIPAIYAEVHGVFTNTVPVDAYRGAGHPEAIYVVERAIEAVARAIGEDSIAVRKQNFIRPEQLPHTTVLDWTYDSGDFSALLDRALVEADHAGLSARRKTSAETGLLRGFGVAHYVKGVRPGLGETSKVTVNPDGSVVLRIGNQDNGQGHRTVFSQIVADRLSLPPERLTLVQGDTDLVPDGNGTGGSRATMNSIPAANRAVDAVIERGREIAAEIMEAAAADIVFEDGIFTVAGTDRRMDLVSVAASVPETDIPELSGEGAFTAEAMSFPNGCHACEVEIDPETGQIRIERYTAVDDFGVVVNPLLLQGQVHGGLVQGIGQALMEVSLYGNDGQLLNGSFMDYQMPRAGDFPDFTLTAVEDYPCRTNPFGIKGAGETGAVGAPPTVINAILDALAPLGVLHIDMPATPERIWHTIREAIPGETA